MDNFLATESANLGFNVTSSNVDVTNLTNKESTNLSELLGKEVPVVAGYTNSTAVVGTGGALGTASGAVYSGSDSSGGYYGGSSGGSSVSTPTPVTTTTATSPTGTIIQQSNTPTIETPVTNTPQVATNTPSQTVINNYYYNNGGGGGGGESIQSVEETIEPPGEPTEETQDVDENYGLQEIVMEEQEVEPEEISHEIPLQEELETSSEVIESEEVIPVETVTPIEPEPEQDSSGQALKTMAILAGAGLTAGAAAIAVHEYKKTKDDNTDDESDEDYDYDGGDK